MYKRMLCDNGVPITSDDRPMTRYALSQPPEIDTSKTEKFLRSITYQGPKIWADLPNHVKNMNDVAVFVTEVKNMIRSEIASIESL